MKRKQDIERTLEISWMKNKPINFYFWLVTYKDGMAIAQYDPYSWEENSYWNAFSYTHEDYSKGIRPKLNNIATIGWYPNNDEIVKQLTKRGETPVLKPFKDETHVVVIDDCDEPYLMREVSMNYTLYGVEKHYVSKYKIGKNMGTARQEYHEIDVKYEIERLQKSFSEE